MAEDSALAEAEAARLAALCVFEAWEELFDHTERMLLNYCIEHSLPRFSHLLQRDDVPPSAPQDGPGWLGLQVTWSNSGLRIDGVHAQSPAAGRLRPCDVIDWIDGYRIAAMDGAGWAMK